MPSDDSGKYESPNRYLISIVETLHSDINGLRADVASEQRARAESEKHYTDRLARLETKIALYSGMGALMGGALVEFASRQLHL